MNENNSQVMMDIADALIERPQGFSIGEEHFYLYPVTLGKMYLLQRIVAGFEVNDTILQHNPYVEAIRIVKTKREDACRYVAYHTLRTKKEVFDNHLVEKRTKFFIENVDEDSLAEILIVLLGFDRTAEFMKELGIIAENKRYAKACNAKSEDSSTISFGGVSIYGNLIDFACERYGWTLDYVVWGISYVNLQLMLADSVKTVYLTKKEQKKHHISSERAISGDDPKNWEKILSMDWHG